MMVKFLQVFIILVVLVFLGLNILSLKKDKMEIEGDLSVLSATLNNLREENEKLKKDIDYFKETENLIKELKSQFNYREEGERLIIIAPADDKNNDNKERD